MGNSVARDFKQVPLGKGSAPTVGIAPGSVILTKPMTVLVKKDDHRNSTIIFDQSTMLPLYVTKVKSRRGTETAITKDAEGKTLFLTVSNPKQNKKLIYRAPEDISDTSKAAPAGGGGGHTHLDTSNHSNTSRSSGVSRFDTDVPCAAQIDIDRSGATVSAFLSMYVWKGDGPELLEVYKAVKIPSVKYGALVTDMEGAAVVGKAFMDETRMQPKIQVAAGSDLPSVVALASAVLGDF